MILSDLRLPDKDGIDLLKWLGEHGLQIPLIIMTGYADIQSAVQTMKLGACDYIAKPVNPDELLKKIGEALNASSSALKQMMHSSRTDDVFTPNKIIAVFLFLFLRVVDDTFHFFGSGIG